MNPAYITCIKDEPALIKHNLTYYYNFGIRNFYIMFNGSEQETRDIVADFVSTHSQAKFTYFLDDNPSYEQPIRFSAMSEKAFEDGCDWMVPVDADEILTMPKYATLQDYLTHLNANRPGYVQFKWFDYHPGDGPDTGGYFTKWNKREKNPNPQGKIIVFWQRGLRYGDGHHLLVTRRERLSTCGCGHYAHFRNREKAQLQRKMLIIGNAFIKHFGEASVRAQIDQYNKMKNDPHYIDKVWAKVERRRQLVEMVDSQIDPKYFV